MNLSIIGEARSPVILIVGEVKQDPVQLSQLSILDSFKKVYVSVSNNTNILHWIQQHQPDLIILDLNSSKTFDWDLITALKLDWLTRDLPILVISDEFSNRLQCKTNIDCNACLTKPYSTTELEQVICSLVDLPNCQTRVAG